MRLDINEAAMSLPAARIAGIVNDKLVDNQRLVITAPPGAGKSTLLPLTILEGLGGDGKIIMVEPRRIAARQIAERMAEMTGGQVGDLVGYRMRFETKVSSRTRIEVVTEGILTRMLAADPALEEYSVVIFDEFHERSLAADEALAMVRSVQDILRPDIRVVIMSATVDTEELSGKLGATVVEAEGRMFLVEIINSLKDIDIRDCAVETARSVLEAHREREGDILAFLPGEAEIRACAEALGDSLGTTRVMPLYGMLSRKEQREAIAPSRPGERKVVIATPIAETSVTIEGVRIVVDSGLCRKMVFDRQSGLSRLETVRISLDMATQRSGRAGRTAPGICHRLWTKATERTMSRCRIPEILEADLAPLVLDVAAWGEPDVTKLPWVTPPAAGDVAKAGELLRLLGATENFGKITKEGKALHDLPCHPRIAKMLLKARTPGLKSLACDIAAVLEERDPFSRRKAAEGMTPRDSDIVMRIEALRSARAGRNHGGSKSGGNIGWSRIIDIAGQYRRIVKAPEDNSLPDAYDAGSLIATAYPERVAKAIDFCGNFRLARGDNARVDMSDSLAAAEWLAVAVMNASPGRAGRIFVAAPLRPDDVSDIVRVRDNVTWDGKNGTIVAMRESRIGSLLVNSRPLSGDIRDRAVEVICAAAEKEGLSMFDFSDAVANLQRRVSLVASWHPELDLPDLGTEAVLKRADEWLPLYIGKATTAAELKKIDMRAVLWGLLDYTAQAAVERIAPTHLTVPTGSRVHIEYRQGADRPVVRVRLQECFGLTDTPRVDDGRVPVLMDLLSPGYKSVQLTSDLRSFWENAYFDVRKELRRRYPKHSWPDNPLEAEAVRGVRKKA